MANNISNTKAQFRPSKTLKKNKQKKKKKLKQKQKRRKITSISF